METLARSGLGRIGSRQSIRGLAVIVRAVAGRIEDWAERARQRRALRELSDHMLKDLGITRYDAEFEARKPFWRP